MANGRFRAIGFIHAECMNTRYFHYSKVGQRSQGIWTVAAMKTVNSS